MSMVALSRLNWTRIDSTARESNSSVSRVVMAALLNSAAACSCLLRRSRSDVRVSSSALLADRSFALSLACLIAELRRRIAEYSPIPRTLKVVTLTRLVNSGGTSKSGSGSTPAMPASNSNTSAPTESTVKLIVPLSPSTKPATRMTMIKQMVIGLVMPPKKVAREANMSHIAAVNNQPPKRTRPLRISTRTTIFSDSKNAMAPKVVTLSSNVRTETTVSVRSNGIVASTIVLSRAAARVFSSSSNVGAASVCLIRVSMLPPTFLLLLFLHLVLVNPIVQAVR